MKSKMEKEIFDYFKEFTLREISRLTGVQITRVFRIKNFGGMKCFEFEKFLEAKEKIESGKF